MSLNEVSLTHSINQLYRYKMNAHAASLGTLLIIQLLGLLLSLIGLGQHGAHHHGVSLSLTSYSGNVIIIFTLIWTFATAMTLTTKPYRDADFVMVTNRLSSHISNLLFIVTISLLGGFSAILSGFLLKLVVAYMFSFDLIIQPTLPFSALVMGIVGTCLLMLLIGSAGYFIGMAAQWHKGLPLFIGAAITALFFIPWETRIIFDHGETVTTYPALFALFRFFVSESSFLIFGIKTLLTMLVLQWLALMIFNRLEVRQ